MINPTQAMSEESSIVEIRRLEDTLTNIDGLASDGFSQIIAISQLALSSMENPSAYAHPERIAKALESIWHTAEHIQSCIFSETCEAGCQSSVTKEIRRLEARRVYEESIAIKRGRP